jgi:hypothetical protein
LCVYKDKKKPEKISSSAERPIDGCILMYFSVLFFVYLENLKVSFGKQITSIAHNIPRAQAISDLG